MTCEGPRWIVIDFNRKLKKMEQSALGRARHDMKGGSKWRGVGVVQEVLGLCSVPTGAEVNEPL